MKIQTRVKNTRDAYKITGSQTEQIHTLSILPPFSLSILNIDRIDALDLSLALSLSLFNSLSPRWVILILIVFVCFNSVLVFVLRFEFDFWNDDGFG